LHDNRDHDGAALAVFSELDANNDPEALLPGVSVNLSASDSSSQLQTKGNAWAYRLGRKPQRTQLSRANEAVASQADPGPCAERRADQAHHPRCDAAVLDPGAVDQQQRDRLGHQQVALPRGWALGQGSRVGSDSQLVSNQI
jgi:hypothetical protein